jgi:hypothetical protein
MSHTLELPEPLYAALQAAAAASGTTPTGWIAARLGENASGTPQQDAPAPPQTLADLFAGRTGRIASGGGECLSEKTGEKFTDHLQAKKEAGHL